MDNVTAKNVIKFVVATILGLFLVVIPLQIGGTIDTISFFYLKKFVNWAGQGLIAVITVCIVISAVLAVVNLICHPKFLNENKLMAALFTDSAFYTVNRVIGAVIAVCVCFNLGPDWLLSEDTGNTMLPLATQLSVLIPPMILFQTLILEFGFMEFFGTIIGFVCKPLFKVSEFIAVNLISAWVGPGNAGIIAAKQMFDDGYYTFREAAIVGSTFSLSSIGWVVLVANYMGVMDHFGLYYATITGVGIIIGIIGVRIPPLSKYEDTYRPEGPAVEPEVTGTGRFKKALILACDRAQVAGPGNFSNKFEGMLSYIFTLQPIIMSWGTIALIIATYTPIFNYISYPIGFVINLFGFSDAYTAGTAILAGICDNYLPVILGGGIEAYDVRFIVATMSLITLIFMSEIGAQLSKSGLVKKFSHVIIIYLERLIIGLPIVMIIAKLAF